MDKASTILVERYAESRKKREAPAAQGPQGLSDAVLNVPAKEWGIMHGPFKMVLCVNQELYDENGKPTKMKPGKVAAQCCHAVLGAYKRAKRKCPGAVGAWETCWSVISAAPEGRGSLVERCDH